MKKCRPFKDFSSVFTIYRSAVKVTLCAYVRTRDLYGTSHIMISNGYGAAVSVIQRASQNRITTVYHIEIMESKLPTITTWKTGYESLPR